MAVSVKQYAAHRGISVQAVRKAIRDGRLAKSSYRNGKEWVIDESTADQEWDANTQRTKSRTSEQINNGKAAAKGLIEPTQSGGVEVNYSKARAYGEGFKAKLLELEFREKAGQLVRVDDVKSETFKTVRLFRDAVLNIPVRVVNELSAVVGDLEPEKRHEMMLIMQREINLALQQLADSSGPS